MSLFKAREWWFTVLGEREEFDQGCLCIGDVDNSGSGHDKIVVGSYMGLLRIYTPHPLKPGETIHAEDLLLEVQLQDPIIQLDMGKFVSCSDLLHLAVLHPKKLSVFAVTATAGNVDHGIQYQIKLMYEHNLQRIACNMTYGPFGGVTGHHFICIQSMDGMLMFFEHESYAFGRFLPGFLLPGPLCYCARTDTFITVSSARQVESYKYEALAIAADTDSNHSVEQQRNLSGKKLMADWTLVIGEQALDIVVSSFNQCTSSVFVLGERNLYCLKDNGQIRFMKKLEYNPSCFLPYTSVSEGTINLLLANHNSVLLVYQDSALKWASQLSCVPVAVRVGNFQDLKGVVVTLSEEGHLQCSYMGSDPSFFIAPKAEAREMNYDDVDNEMKTLQKTIKEATKMQDILPKTSLEDELKVTASVSASMDAMSRALLTEIADIPVPSVTVKIQLMSHLSVQSPKLSVCVQPPLAVTQEQFVLDSMDPGSTCMVLFSAYLKEPYPPADLEGHVVVTYSTPTGVVRVVQCIFTLPFRLVSWPSTPSNHAKHKIIIDTNKSPVNLTELYPDFLMTSEDKECNAVAFQLIAGSVVTVQVSKTSQRYRIQSDVFEDMWLVTKELIQRINNYFTKQGVKDFQKSFAGPVPLTEYFQIVDHHFELRVNAGKYHDLLSERAVQFRAIQRRLLTRFKDKTPAPLQNLDTLMEGTYRQVIALADAAEDNQALLCQAFARLCSATHLLITLISLWLGLNASQIAILEASLLPLLPETPQLGWEESVDAAVSHLLHTCLSRSPKDQALSLSTSELSMPRDTGRLKKHIALLCDRLGKGGRLSSEGHAHSPIIMPGDSEAVSEVEFEPTERQVSAAQLVKKKQSAKKSISEKLLGIPASDPPGRYTV
ncbi:protein PTHB1 isoform X2 [Brienomyrus brachyistius]|uniref:protein PTHB1 isoform X2 n=1 Tax=Brienomyrus brachyistius TaxID=42636 RepID=UPI0020B33B95|nr:protein PTHB1 isoform X2 [Brienomyrus brachyistius]